MNKKELVHELKERVGSKNYPKANITLATAENFLESFIDIVGETLEKGDKLKIPGLGIFSVGTRAARTCIAPGSKKKIQVPARKAAKFTASKKIKDRVAATTKPASNKEAKKVQKKKK